MQFLARISLIDDIDVRNAGAEVTVTANLIKVGQLRDQQPQPGQKQRPHANRRRSAAATAVYGSSVRQEVLKIRWEQNGIQREDLNDVQSFTGSAALLGGSWKCIVIFETDEIRSDPNSLTISELDFAI